MPGDFVIPVTQFGQFGPIKVTADFTLAAWNTVADHRICNVVGLAAVNVIAINTSGVTGGAGATLAFGYQAAGNVMTAQVVTNFTTGTIWRTAGSTPVAHVQVNNYSPAAAANLYGQVMFGTALGSSSSAIGYSVAVNALTGGATDFYIYWTPISPGAVVTPGTGNAF